MIRSSWFKQVTKYLLSLLQITEMCPSICELTKEEKKEEEAAVVAAAAVPSGLRVTSADHHNQQGCR